MCAPAPAPAAGWRRKSQRGRLNPKCGRWAAASRHLPNNPLKQTVCTKVNQFSIPLSIITDKITRARARSQLAKLLNWQYLIPHLRIILIQFLTLIISVLKTDLDKHQTGGFIRTLAAPLPPSASPSRARRPPSVLSVGGGRGPAVPESHVFNLCTHLIAI